MTRGELKQTALDALNRKDMGSQANIWVQAAHSRINTMLRHRKMIKHKVLAVTDRMFSVPNDFIEADNVRINSGVNGGVIAPGAGKGELLYTPPSEIAAAAAMSSVNATFPEYYTMHGLEMELAPWRGAGAYQVEIWYYAKLSLSMADDATNFFLEEFPHVYLNGVMAYGHRHLLEPEAATGYDVLLGGEIQAINEAERMAKVGNGPLIVRQSHRIGGRYS